VQSYANPANRAERPVTLLASGITSITAPPPGAVLVSGLPFTFGWQYVGQPGRLKILLLRTGSSVPYTVAADVAPGTLGVGQLTTSVGGTLWGTPPGQYQLRLASLAHPPIMLSSQLFWLKHPITVFGPAENPVRAGQPIQVGFEFYKTHSTAAAGGQVAMVEIILLRHPFGPPPPGCGMPPKPPCPGPAPVAVLARVPAQQGNNTVMVTMPAPPINTGHSIEVKEVGAPSTPFWGHSGVFYVTQQ
jgi:hypothetical protein